MLKSATGKRRTARGRGAVNRGLSPTPDLLAMLEMIDDGLVETVRIQRKPKRAKR